MRPGDARPNDSTVSVSFAAALAQRFMVTSARAGHHASCQHRQRIGAHARLDDQAVVDAKEVRSEQLHPVAGRRTRAHRPRQVARVSGPVANLGRNFVAADDGVHDRVVDVRERAAHPRDEFSNRLTGGAGAATRATLRLLSADSGRASRVRRQSSHVLHAIGSTGSYRQVAPVAIDSARCDANVG
jgi:hypothetical protein